MTALETQLGFNVFKLLDHKLGSLARRAPGEYSDRNQVTVMAIQTLEEEHDTVENHNLTEILNVVNEWVIEFYDLKAR